MRATDAERGSSPSDRSRSTRAPADARQTQCPKFPRAGGSQGPAARLAKGEPACRRRDGGSVAVADHDSWHVVRGFCLARDSGAGEQQALPFAPQAAAARVPSSIFELAAGRTPACVTCDGGLEWSDYAAAVCSGMQVEASEPGTLLGDQPRPRLLARADKRRALGGVVLALGLLNARCDEDHSRHRAREQQNTDQRCEFAPARRQLAQEVAGQPKQSR
jgi:hypothetical protein